MIDESIQQKVKNDTHQQKNILEKIIKLDKKNSSLNLYDKKKNKRIVIRNHGMNSSLQLASNQTEHNLRTFWRHLNQYYFKKIEENDLERINYLINLLSSPIKEPYVKYADSHAYYSFKDIITDYYKNLYNDHFLNKLNLHNLQKNYQIEIFISNLLPKNSGNNIVFELFNDNNTHHNNNHFHKKDKLIKIFQKLLGKRHKPAPLKGNKKHIKGFLLEEANTIDEIISTMDEIQEDNTKNEISNELEELIQQQKTINYANLKMLNDLHSKTKAELIYHNENEIQAYMNYNNINHNHKLMKDKISFEQPSIKHKNLTASETVDTQIKYLGQLILTLENKQAAESIKFVQEFNKCSNIDGKSKFLIVFDPALTTKQVWLDEKTIEELDKLRETTLFRIHNLPQKCMKSISSQNIIGFTTCIDKIQNKDLIIKDELQHQQSHKDIMKKRHIFKDNHDYHDIISYIDQYSICHHCKNLYHNQYLIKCNYRSSLMGLPIANTVYVDPTATSAAVGGGLRAPKRTIFNNKRSVYSFYIKKNGELYCQRKFCRLCLKQNYDQNLAEIADKHDWICPFCKGNCFCSRCLRNDHLNKLINMFIILGGDIAEIKKQSYLEKYIHIPDTNIIKNSKKTKYILKPTSLVNKSSYIKFKIKKFKENLKKFNKLKNLRVHLEKVRLLCSQVTKRETLKYRIEMLNEALLNQKFSFNNLEVINNMIKSSNQKKNNIKSLSNSEDVSLDQINLENGLLQKRKRGRPRKNVDDLEPNLTKAVKTNSQNKINIATISDSTTYKIEFDGTNIKRKGRPPKNKNKNLNKIQSQLMTKNTMDKNKSYEEQIHSKENLNSIKVESNDDTNDMSQMKKMAYRLPATRISKHNPNEPNDNYDEKPFKLKRELQGIMQDQKIDDLLAINNIPWDNTHHRPLTRTSTNTLLKSNCKNIKPNGLKTNSNNVNEFKH